MGNVVKQYADQRSKKVVFLGHCLLNQNIRGFGVGVTGGAIAEIVRELLDHGVGIEQLPCPECEVWGGIARNGLYRWQPLVYRSGSKWWFPLLRAVMSVDLYLTHGRNCRRAARRAVAVMHDHVRQGYQVLGVVTSNDSPTCGVTKTMDLLDVANLARKSGTTLTDLQEPRLDKMRPFLKGALSDGAGALVAGIVKELRRRKLDVKVLGWDPWADAKTEAARVVTEIGLAPASGAAGEA